MDTMAFNQSIQLTHMRENLIGSALARYFNSSIHFIEDNERRSEYDFSLYNPIKGWAFKFEAQDDYYTESMNGTLCIELFRYISQEKKKEAKLFYTKADKLVFILNRLKKLIIVDVKILKKLVADLESSRQLLINDPEDHEAWRDKHDTNPTACALVPIEEVLLADPKARVFDFDDLNLKPELYDQLRFRKENHD